MLDFIAVIAAENKTGTITESRIATTRKAIAAEIDRFGIDAVAYGLSECVTREKPALGYAVACARKYGERLAIRPPTQLRIVPSLPALKLDERGRPEGFFDDDFPDVRTAALLEREKAFA